MLTRVERKLAEMQRWVDSVGSVADWPAAIALALMRTRPSRDGFPRLWLAPRRLAGLQVHIDPRNMSHFAIYEEVFMDGLYDLDLVPFMPDAIVDCGAFEGYFSLLAHARFPSAPVIAFEPNRDNYRGLLANLSRNDLAIDAREAAVSTRDGSAAFTGGGCGGQLSDEGRDTTTVVVEDLRRVITSMQCRRLLLKLDIEGEEAALLPALLPVLPAQCAMFFEWHHGVDAFRAAAATLDSHGFTTTLTKNHRTGDDTPFVDAFAARC